MKTLSLTVTDEIHAAMHRLKREWRLGNLDSVLETCVVKALEEIEKTQTTPPGGEKIG